METHGKLGSCGWWQGCVNFPFFFPAGSPCAGASQSVVLIWDVIYHLWRAHTLFAPAQDWIWVRLNPNHYLVLQIRVFFWPDWKLCWAVHRWFSLSQQPPPKCFLPCQWALIFQRQKARTSSSQQVSRTPAGPDALLQSVIFIVSLFPSLSECKLLIILPGVAKPENFDPSNESVYHDLFTELQPVYPEHFSVPCEREWLPSGLASWEK